MKPDTLLKPCFDTWNRQKQEGYVFISEKSSQGWKDHGFKWPDERYELVELVKRRQKDGIDLYWAPLMFETRKRDINKVLRANTLFADLDPVNPEGLDERPTIAWMSSKDRFQALWWLDRMLDPEELMELNRGLTYAIGADKGGWDLTQVLRIPNTYNYKYNPPRLGKLLWHEKKNLHSPKTFRKYKEAPNQGNDDNGVKNTQSLIGLLSKYRKKIPSKVSRILQYPPSRVEEGHRSDMLWYIESELVNAQIPMEDIVAIIQMSVWNKYKGRRDEMKRLTTEISKVYDAVQSGQNFSNPEGDTIDEPEELEKELPFTAFNTLMGGLQSSPGWLVKDIWLRRSHGMIAGEPKTFKSTIALDLAVSVASGVPLWNRYEVHETGPVIIIQNENAEWIIRDRMEKILASKNIVGDILRTDTIDIQFPPDLPIHFLNNYGYNFSDPLHRDLLEKSVKEIKPALIILDPLYLMFEGELNSAKDLQPILQWLLELRNKYRTAVIVIHHSGKNSQNSRGGQRMLGSTTLHGWTESALYMQLGGETIDEQTRLPLSKVILEREFRAAGIMPKLNIEIAMGDFGDPFYEPRLTEAQTPAAASNDLLDLLSMYPNGLSISQAAKELGMSRRTVSNMADSMKDKIKVVRGEKNSSKLVLCEEEVAKRPAAEVEKKEGEVK